STTKGTCQSAQRAIPPNAEKFVCSRALERGYSLYGQSITLSAVTHEDAMLTCNHR
ncbi:hypothetical protein TSAR_010415, partial [Trichomalopsis sarcophagae]